jgi:hypothetical protein
MVMRDGNVTSATAEARVTAIHQFKEELHG